MFYHTSGKVSWGRSWESISHTRTVYDFGVQSVVGWFRGRFFSVTLASSFFPPFGIEVEIPAEKFDRLTLSDEKKW